MVTNMEKKPKVEITWLQCQLPKADWQALNERRLKLNLKWADIIVPATVEYIGKLEVKPTDADTAAPAVATIQNKADKKTSPSKSKRVKKAPAADNSKSK